MTSASENQDTIVVEAAVHAGETDKEIENHEETPMEINTDQDKPTHAKEPEDTSEHGITIVETTLDDTGETKSSAEQNTDPSRDITKLLQPGKIKSLADLINVCRDGGIQVYNDTPNIPGKEKERIEELKRQGVDPEDERKHHNSDHLEPHDPRRRRLARKRKNATKLKPLADDIIISISQGKQVFSDKANVPDSDLNARAESSKQDLTDRDDARRDTVSSSKSPRSRRSRRSSPTSSFMSSSTAYGPTDDPPGNVTSEDWLQERMRRRSRRRKDKSGNVSLVNVIQRKQQEIERQSMQSQSVVSSQEPANDKPDKYDVMTKSDNPRTDKNNDSNCSISHTKCENQISSSKTTANVKPKIESGVIDPMKIENTLSLSENEIKGKSSSPEPRSEVMSEVQTSKGKEAENGDANTKNVNTSEGNKKFEYQDKSIKTEKRLILTDNNTIDNEVLIENDKLATSNKEQFENSKQEITENSYQASGINKVAVANIPKETEKKQDLTESQDVTMRSTTPGKVTEEVRIKDGETTLVLYKVRERIMTDKQNSSKDKSNWSQDTNNVSEQECTVLTIGGNANKTRCESTNTLCSGKTDITDEFNNSSDSVTLDAHKTKTNGKRCEIEDSKGINHDVNARGTLTHDADRINDNTIDLELKERESTVHNHSVSSTNGVNKPNGAEELVKSHSHNENYDTNLRNTLQDSSDERSTDLSYSTDGLVNNESLEQCKNKDTYDEQSGTHGLNTTRKSHDENSDGHKSDDNGICPVSSSKSERLTIQLNENTGKHDSLQVDHVETNKNRDTDRDELVRHQTLEDDGIDKSGNMMFMTKHRENASDVVNRPKKNGTRTKNNGKVKFAIDQCEETYSVGIRSNASTSLGHKDDRQRAEVTSEGERLSEPGSGSSDARTEQSEGERQTEPSSGSSDARTEQGKQRASTSDLSITSSRGKQKGKTRTSSMESWKSLSSQARILLITTRLRQDHSEQVSMSSSYLETLEETRASLRNDYSKFRKGVDIDKSILRREDVTLKDRDDMEEPLEDTLELEKRLQSEEREQRRQEEERRRSEAKELKEREADKVDNKIIEAERENKKRENAKQINDDQEKVNSKKVPQTEQEEDKQDSRGEELPVDIEKQGENDLEEGKDPTEQDPKPIVATTDSQIGKSEREDAKMVKIPAVVNTDPNSHVVKSIKKKASSRLNTKWSKDHPAYKQIANGFKSESKIPDTRNVSRALLKLKHRNKYDSSNIPEDSVYLEEAKRLTPHHFDSPYQSPKRKYIRREVQGNGLKPLPDIEQPHIDDHTDYIPQTKNNARNSQSDSSNSSTENKSQSFSSRRSEELVEIYDRSRIPRPTNKRVAQQSKSLDRNPARVMEFNSYKNSRDAESPRLKHKYSNAQGTDNGKAVETNSLRDITGNNDDKNEVSSGSHGGLANASSSTIKSGKGSIDVAVDIVKSRKEFYHKGASIQENVIPRQHRVMKLFKEIQMIRKVADHMETTSGTFNDPSSGFLWMNYDVTTHRKVARQKNDSDLRKFLYEHTQYELCSKTKNVNSNWGTLPGSTFKRKDRALDELKSKLFTKA